jgi:thiosulfate/3-mercaptopyruvate sulfurtransferase
VTGYARPELLATTDWLAENFSRPELRVLDVRWRPDGTGYAAYAAGHVPGAAYLDWARDLVGEEDQGASFLLAPPDQVAAALARAGVDDGTTIVVYDDSLSIFAARTWWSLRAYGFEAVRILDGGIAEWIDERRHLSNRTAPPARGSFHPRGQLRMRLTAADVRATLDAPDVLLLDARAPAEYTGLEGGTRRLGHIPGAVNVPVAAMHRPGTQRFRDGDSLRTQIAKAGVTRGKRLVCYDGSGLAACKLAFVLMLLGYEDVAVFDGGWAEWGDRLELPVER